MFRNLLPSLYKRSPAERGESGGKSEFFPAFEEFFRAPFGELRAMGFPAVDVVQEDDAVVVTAEIPGLEPKDLELSLEHGNLVISGEKRYERKGSEEGASWRERGYGSFHRVIPLPEGVDEADVQASSKNGVLTVRLPLDPKRKPRRIAIQG